MSVNEAALLKTDIFFLNLDQAMFGRVVQRFHLRKMLDYTFTLISIYFVLAKNVFYMTAILPIDIIGNIVSAIEELYILHLLLPSFAIACD